MQHPKRSVRVILLAGSGLVLYLVGINSVATQYVAAYYAYHPALGRPVFAHLYKPWDWFVWQQLYFASARALYSEVMLALLVALSLGFFGYVLVVGFRTRSSQIHDGIHGTAHFASETEIRATGLIPRPGQRGAGA